MFNIKCLFVLLLLSLYTTKSSTLSAQHKLGTKLIDLIIHQLLMLEIEAIYFDVCTYSQDYNKISSQSNKNESAG